MLADGRKSVKRRSRDRRRGEPGYVACGIHPVAAFLEARPDEVDAVLATRESRDEVESLARAAGLRVQASDPRTLANLAGGAVHQGVAAIGKPPRAWDLEELLGADPQVVVVLDGLTDPRNVGAVMRSAEASGAGGIIMAKDRAPRLTPALVKAAAGAVEWLPIVRATNLVRALEKLKASGLWVVGLDGAGPTELGRETAIPGLPAALVLGAEGAGLRSLVARHCDRLIRIPMLGRTPSFNVSVAAGIGLWELARLRK